MLEFVPRTIVVGTDFGEAATAALRFADRIADEFDAGITLVHASPFIAAPFGSPFGFPDAMSSELLLEQEMILGDRLQQYVRELSLSPERISTLVTHASPVEAILRTADACDAGLIITGRDGHRPIRHFLLGSVAERVVHRSARPVMTVPVGAEEPVRSILCPVNFSQVAKDAAQTAARIAATLGAELTLLHLVEPYVFADLEGEFDRMARFLGESLVNSASTKVLVQRGEPSERVLLYARAHHVDLLVVGSQHRRFVDVTVIGSTTEKLTRFASCAVLTVPRPLDVAGKQTPAAVAAERE